MDLLNVLIVEDEQAAQATIVEYCGQHPRLKVSGIVTSGKDFLEKILKTKYDLVIMDIELEDTLGTLALRQAPRLPPIVISTAHPQYAVEAFELGVVDFLLKPYSIERFLRSVNRVIEAAERADSKKDLRSIGVSVKTGDNFFFIPFHEIVYVASQGKGSVIHTVRTEHYTPRLLMSIAEKLPQTQFLRVHKQFLLNLSFISHLQHMAKGDYLAFLKDEEQSQIPISRNHSAELKSRLGLQ